MCCYYITFRKNAGICHFITSSRNDTSKMDLLFFDTSIFHQVLPLDLIFSSYFYLFVYLYIHYFLLEKHLWHTVCGCKNDIWHRNMMLIKNSQFSPNSFETWSKMSNLWVGYFLPSVIIIEWILWIFYHSIFLGQKPFSHPHTVKHRKNNLFLLKLLLFLSFEVLFFLRGTCLENATVLLLALGYLKKPKKSKSQLVQRHTQLKCTLLT